MKKLFLLLFVAPAIMLLAFFVEATVYKVLDEKGNITYTDTPPADADAAAITLPAITEIPSVASPVEMPSDRPSPDFAGYSRVALVAPEDDSLVHYDQREVLVQLTLTPALQPGHLVQFYFDQTAYGKPLAATSRTITDLERGAHTVSARVYSPQGAVLAISKPVTIHVQRHFIRN